MSQLSTIALELADSRTGATARVDRNRAATAAKVLDACAIAWFGVAAFGQLLFVTYIVGFYGVSTVTGNFDAWNRVLPHGYVAGEFWGNLLVGVHVLGAAAITAAGVLQIIPAVRRRWPVFHRWSGRFYLVAAFVMSLGGIAMIATRGTIGAPIQKFAIVLNGLLIMLFAVLALHYARRRRIDVHRRWALRLFLAVSGVWFLRVMLMGWIVVNGGPVGFDPKTFSGPFLTFAGFANYLLPLVLLELYFQAQQRGGAMTRFAVASLLSLATVATLIGVLSVSALLWLPRLS